MDKRFSRARRSHLERLEERLALTIESSFFTILHDAEPEVASQQGLARADLEAPDVLVQSAEEPKPPALVTASLSPLDQRPYFEWSAGLPGVSGAAVQRYEAVVTRSGGNPDALDEVVRRGVIDSIGGGAAMFEEGFGDGQFDFFVRSIDATGVRSEWSDGVAFESPESDISLLPYSASAVLAPSPQAAESASHQINFDFIERLEGGILLDAYVPLRNGVPVGQSGVTIAAGFDLGQHDQAFLDSTGWPQDLIDRLSPYLGLKGVDAQVFLYGDADQGLAANELTVSQEEGELIAEVVRERKAVEIIAAYDAASSVAFADLPEPAQTVIASVAFQYGSNLASATPNFWGFVTTQDYTSAIAELNDFNDQFSTRRETEADYLESGLASLGSPTLEFGQTSLVDLYNEVANSPLIRDFFNATPDIPFESSDPTEETFLSQVGSAVLGVLDEAIVIDERGAVVNFGVGAAVDLGVGFGIGATVDSKRLSAAVGAGYSLSANLSPENNFDPTWTLAQSAKLDLGGGVAEASAEFFITFDDLDPNLPGDSELEIGFQLAGQLNETKLIEILTEINELLDTEFSVNVDFQDPSVTHTLQIKLSTKMRVDTFLSPQFVNRSSSFAAGLAHFMADVPSSFLVPPVLRAAIDVFSADSPLGLVVKQGFAGKLQPEISFASGVKTGFEFGAGGAVGLGAKIGVSVTAGASVQTDLVGTTLYKPELTVIGPESQGLDAQAPHELPSTLRMRESDDKGQFNNDAVTRDTRPLFQWQAAEIPGNRAVNRFEYYVATEFEEQGRFEGGITTPNRNGLVKAQPRSVRDTPDGDYYLWVRRDYEGAPWVGGYKYTIDTEAPAAVGSLTVDAITPDTTPNFSWAAVSDAVRYEVDFNGPLLFDQTEFYVDGTQLTEADFASVGPLVSDLDRQSGVWEFTVRAEDLAGNQAVAAAPSIFRFRPGGVSTGSAQVNANLVRPATLGPTNAPSIDVALERIFAPRELRTSIERDIPTWVVIHGIDDSSSSMRRLAEEIAENQPGSQVLVLDWADGAFDNVSGSGNHASLWIPSVAQWAAQELANLGLSSDDLFLVGDGWGSQLAWAIANQTPGGVRGLVALDPGAEPLTLDHFDSDPVNFAAVSALSWSFYGDGNRSSATRSGTADESFEFDYQAGAFELVSDATKHVAPRLLFTTLIDDTNADASHELSRLFALDRLVAGERGPWRADTVSGGTFIGERVFEGKFTLNRDGNVGGWGDSYNEIVSLSYVDDATGDDVEVDPEKHGPIARIIETNGDASDLRLDLAGVLGEPQALGGFNISNIDGDEPLEVTGLSIGGDFSRFEVFIVNDGQLYTQEIASLTDSTGRFIDSFFIPAGRVARITVGLKNDSVGEHDATFNFSHNGGGDRSPVSVQLIGGVAEPAGERSAAFFDENGVAASTIVFPGAPVGQVGGTRTATFRNTGQKTVTIESIDIVGEHVGDYRSVFDIQPGTVLLPGGSLPLNVQFTPTATGDRTAQLVVSHNAGEGVSVVTLSTVAAPAPAPAGDQPTTDAAWNPALDRFDVTVREGDVIAIDLAQSVATQETFRASGDWSFAGNLLGDFRDASGALISENSTSTLPGSTVYFAPRPNTVNAAAVGEDQYVTSVTFIDSSSTERTVRITVVPDAISTGGVHSVAAGTAVLVNDATGISSYDIDYRDDPDGDGKDDSSSGVDRDGFEVATLRVQQRLRYLGFLGTDAEPLAVDGRAGKKTFHAVAVFNSAAAGDQQVYTSPEYRLREDWRDANGNGTITRSENRSTLSYALSKGWGPANKYLTQLNTVINKDYAPRWVELEPKGQFFFRSIAAGDASDQPERWGASYAQLLLDALAEETDGQAFETGRFQNMGSSLQPGGETPFHGGHESGSGFDININGANDSGSTPFFHTRSIGGQLYVAKPDADGPDDVLVRKDGGGWEYQPVPEPGDARTTFLQRAVRREEVQELRSSPADLDSVLLSEYLYDASGYSSNDVERILRALSKYAEEPVRDAQGNAVAIVDKIWFNDPLFFAAVPGGGEFTQIAGDTDRVRQRTPLTAVEPLSYHNGHIHVQLKTVDPADYPLAAPAQTNGGSSSGSGDDGQALLPQALTAGASERLLSSEERAALSQGLHGLVPTVVDSFVEAAPTNTALQFLAIANGDNTPVLLSDLYGGMQEALDETLVHSLTDYLDSSHPVTAEGLIRETIVAEYGGDTPRHDGQESEQDPDVAEGTTLPADQFGLGLFSAPEVQFSGTEIVFSTDFETSRTDEFQWALGEDATAFGFQVGADVTASLITSLSVSLEYGLDLSSGTPEFFFRFDDPVVGSVRTLVDGADLGFKIGDVGLGVEEGTANLNAQIAVDFGDSEFRLGQSPSISLSGLGVDVSGSFDMTLPLALTIGSYSLPVLPVVSISVPDLFDDPDIQFSVTEADAVGPFAGITNEGLLSVLNQTAGWLGSLSSRVLGVDVALLGEGLLDEYAHLGTVINSFLLPAVQDAEGNPTFGTIQELEQILEEKVSGLELGFDVDRQAVTLSFSAEDRTSLFETDLDLDVSLGEFAELSTGTKLSVTAGYDLDLGLALELRESEASIVGDRPLPSNGRLTNNAVLRIQANGIDPLTITVNRDTSNGSPQDLIDDINAAIVAAGVTGVVASLTDENHLKLTAPRTFSVAFLAVDSIPSNNSAQTVLGLANGQFAREDAIDRTWIDSASASADLLLAANPIEATARVGRAAIEVVDGFAEANISVAAEVLNPQSGLTEPVRLSTLIDSLISEGFDAVSSITLGGMAELDLSNVRTVGSELPVPGIPGANFKWDDIFQPLDVVATYNGDFDLLLAARFIALENVLSLLRDVSSWLKDVESSPALSTPLPVLNKSVSEVIRLSQTVDDLVNRLVEVGPESLQDISLVIREFVEEVTGAVADFDPLKLEGPDLKFDLNWLAQVSEQGAVALQTDLASIGFNGQESVVGAGAGAQVAVVGQSGVDVTFGLDLTTPTAPVAYIEDDARVFAELFVDADDVDADFSFGPLGVFIVDGTVDLNNGVDENNNPLPARIEVGLNDDPTDGRHNLIEAVGQLTFVSEGNAEVVLPTFFPTASSPVNGNPEDNGSNNIIFRVGDLGDVLGSTTLSAPPLDSFLDNIDFDFDLSALTGDWNALLLLLEDALDGELFGINLPLIGDELREAGNFIRSFREAGETELGNLSVYSLAAVRTAFYQALGPDGANVILDRQDDDDEIVTIDDFEVVVTDDNNDGKTDAVQFDVMLGQENALVDHEVDFDLGLEGIGLEVDGKVQVDTGWQFDFGFGISKQHGVYIDTTAGGENPEITVGLTADIPGLAATGQLGFLQAEIRDDSDDPTSFTAGMSVDLIDFNDDGRLTLSELRSGGLSGLDQATDFEISAVLDANLEIETGTTVEVLPSFQVDLNIDWVFEAFADATPGGDDSEDSRGLLPEISFSNVRLNLGSFISGVLNPAVGHIDGVLEQIRPAIDLLTTPVPVISDLGEDLTIIDLARIYGFERTADFLDAAVTFFQIADALPSGDGQDVYLDLGSFTLAGFDARPDEENSGEAEVPQPQEIDEPTTEPIEQAKQNSGPLAGILNSLENLTGGAVQFPILETPQSAFLFLLGQDVDLVLYDMPAAELEFEATTNPFYVFGPVYVQFGASVGAGIDLAFGYDTRGIRQFQESGDIGDIFNGLFVDERDTSGRDDPEAFITGALEAKAAVGIPVIASVGVEGGVELTIGADLVDPNRDGKVYLDEAGDQLDEHGFACLFDVGGLLEAFLEIEVETFGLTTEIEIARTTLADFTLHSCSTNDVVNDRFENNNTQSRAAFLGNGPGINVTGTSISSANDQDWYRFDVHRADTLDVRVNAASGLATEMLILDSEGNEVATTSRASGSSTATIDVEPGTYFVQVRGDGATGTYDLFVTPAASSATTVYYVNATDAGAPSENSYYTLAQGSSTNTGLSPTSPLHSVQAVLNGYDVGPDDVIVVDSGSYSGATVINAADAGAAIWGSPGGSVLDSAGATFTLDSADGVLLTDFEFVGSGEGVVVQGGSADYKVIGNTFTEKTVAARVVSDVGGVIAENDVLGEMANTGFILEAGASTAVYDNELRELALGISSASPNVAVYGNDIAVADLGLQITGAGVIGPVTSSQASNTVRLGGIGATVEGDGRLVGNSFFEQKSGVVASGNAVIERNNLSDIETIGIDANGNVILQSNRVDDTPTAVRTVGMVTLIGNRLTDADTAVLANTGAAVDGQNYTDNTIIDAVVGVDFQDVGSIGNTQFANNEFKRVGTALQGDGVTSLTSFTFRDNEIEGGQFGVLLPDTSTTTDYLIQANDVQAEQFGLDINGTPEFIENIVRDSAVGVRATSTVVLGGPDWETYEPNLIYGNTTGVDGGGEIRFNRIYDNSVGLATIGGVSVHHNLVYRNTDTGILADSTQGLSVVNNTIDAAPSADGVRLVGGTRDAFLRNNIYWTEAGGYGLYVEPFSHYGLDSDYNNYFATNSGRLTHLKQAYDDILDWRIESPYDQHSIGFTEPDPSLDNPLFLDRAGANYRLTPQTSPSIDAGDPLTGVGDEPGVNGGLVNQGAYGGTALSAASRSRYVEIVYPEFYTDVEINDGQVIQWRGYDESQPGGVLSGTVDIDLTLPDGTKVLDLGTANAADGQFVWNVDSADLTPDLTQRYRVRLSTLGASDSTREAFTIVPESTEFYVDDYLSNSGDVYTPGALGDNRNTGKTADAPKRSIHAIFDNYDLDPLDVVSVDAGEHVFLRGLLISGVLGVGDDEGVIVQGPAGVGELTVFDRWDPNPDENTVRYGIEVNNGDFVTLRDLTVIGGFHNAFVHTDSNDFTAQGLTLRDAGNHGFVISSPSVNSTAADVTVSGAGLDGFWSSARGLRLTGLELFNNAEDGLELTDAGGAIIQSSVSHNNGQDGFEFDNNNFATRTLFGDFDLTAGLGNTAHGNAADGVNARDGVDVVGNVAYENRVGIRANGGVLAQHNVSHANEWGFVGFSSGIVRENRTYNNSVAGIYGNRNPLIEGNVIYSSPDGIQFPDFAFSGYTNNTVVENNVIYDIDNRGFYSVESRAILTNNTFYMPEGRAIVIDRSSANVKLRNNIFSVGDGPAITIDSGSQSGFESDFNLFDLYGGSSIGVWQDVSQPSLTQWSATTFHDLTSIEANALFVSPTGTDGILGYEEGASDGADDDFHLRSVAGRPTGSFAPILDPVSGLPQFAPSVEVSDAETSAAIDRGDEATPFGSEPDPNGGFVNIGAFGGTSLASKSPEEYVLVINPDGSESWITEQSFEIEWRSRLSPSRVRDGDYRDIVSASSPEFYLHFNDPLQPFADHSGNGLSPDVFGSPGLASSGAFGLDRAVQLDGTDDYLDLPDGFADLTAGFSYNVWAYAETVDSWSRYFDFGNGAASDNIALARDAGSDDLRFWIFRGSGSTSVVASDVLKLNEWQMITATYDGATMRIYVDGQEVASTASTPPNVIQRTQNYIGRSNWNDPFYQGSFDQSEFHNRALTPQEIQDRFNARPTDSADTVDIVAVNEGTGEEVVVAEDVVNSGQFIWEIPADFPASESYRIKVTSNVDGTLSDLSNDVFSISEATNTYYVNIADDADFSDNEYTNTAGDDANDGLTAATPKASIRAILDSFDLDPGDTILVDTGTYNLGANILLSEEDSGVTIRGPQQDGNAAVIDRGNTSGGQYVFELLGGR